MLPNTSITKLWFRAASPSSLAGERRVYRLVLGLAALLLIVFNVAPFTIVRAESEYAYVLIEDVIGRVWSYSNVQRLLNTTFNGQVVGEYFYLVIDKLKQG